VYAKNMSSDDVTLVTVGDDAQPGNWDTPDFEMDADGSHFIVRTRATNLVTPLGNQFDYLLFVGGPQAWEHITDPLIGNLPSTGVTVSEPVINNVGSVAAFTDQSPGLITQNDTNGSSDAVRWTSPDTLDRISEAADPLADAGTAVDQFSSTGSVAISDDGQTVAFLGRYAVDQMAVSLNNCAGDRIYVSDTNGVRCVDVNIRGETEWFYASRGPLAMSGDGRYLMFASEQQDLDPICNSSTGAAHLSYVYVADLTSDEVACLQIGEDRAPIGGQSAGWGISRDGTTVYFAGHYNLMGIQGTSFAQIYKRPNPLYTVP
jgi:hypothetical protein